MPSVNMMGANTQTVVRVEAIMAPPTCLAPSTAAFFTECPFCRSRKIFSITTTELSTSIPTPSARPDRDMIFSVTPLKYMATMAATTLRGIEHATIMVGRISHRNRSRIIMASAPPTRRFWITASTTRSI